MGGNDLRFDVEVIPKVTATGGGGALHFPRKDTEKVAGLKPQGRAIGWDRSGSFAFRLKFRLTRNRNDPRHCVGKIYGFLAMHDVCT